MEITFPELVKPKVTALGTVTFQAQVDGEYIWCEVSIEVLIHHCSAPSRNSSDLLHSFQQCRQRILHTAKKYLEINGGRSVLLMTRDFC